MHVTPARLVKHLEAWGVDYVLAPGWDNPIIDPYDGANDMDGIVLHHTAGKDSLAFCMRGTYPPVRNCHVLVDRAGKAHVLSGTGAYHAGAGGPWRITKRLTIPKDRGNSRLYGIEIESLGTSARIDGSPQGMTRAQVITTALLCAAMLDAMRLGPLSLRVGRVIRHRDWTTRKIDTRQDLTWWRAAVSIAKTAHRKTRRSKAISALAAFVADNPRGVLHP